MPRVWVTCRLNKTVFRLQFSQIHHRILKTKYFIGSKFTFVHGHTLCPWVKQCPGLHSNLHTCCWKSKPPHPPLQLYSLAGYFSSSFFFFYIFTLSDKAPVAFSIMLCRCSQQKRVIALGVWSSLRRIGSSGQNCQGLSKDPPDCVCVRACHLAARMT